MAYTWIPFYKEFAQKLLQFRNDRQPLIDWIYSNINSEYIKHLKDAPDGRRVADVDPFTVYAIFNRGISHDKRVEICQTFKDYLNVSASVPKDFDGIPVMNTQQSNFMAFANKREDGDIERLWNVFEAAVLGKDIENSYNALEHQYLVKFNLTFGLFWIRPDLYLPLDSRSQNMLNSIGITFDNTKFLRYKEYKEVMNRLDVKMQTESLGFSNYAEFSYIAFLNTSKKQEKEDEDGNTIAYWLYAPGEQAVYWDEYYQDGLMGLGWNKIGDLKEYRKQQDLVAPLKQHYGADTSQKNNADMLYGFANEMKPGDIVFAKKGRSMIVGRGVVTSDYYYDGNRENQPHLRKVNWTHKGEWKSDSLLAMKTLTNISRFTDLVKQLDELIEEKDSKEQSSSGQNYWWLVANPKIWSLSEMKVDEEQSYTMYSESGHPRRVYQNFVNAKEGDVVIGYESSPTKQIVGLLTITKVKKEDCIYFKKIETLPEPISFSTIKETPGLEAMEYMKNQQGSFFKVTPDEYDIIMELIRSVNPLAKKESNEPYTDKKFLDEVFVTQDEYIKLRNLLLRKKNLILQGAPGVGKTFAARRLAYAIMGEKDDSRVMQVQFHQNYSYEDFVMGYKPNENGGFNLNYGIFHKFCRRASIDKERPYFFIIDEINRGNLSKIFGELLMLIENDYRDKPIQLSYNDETFAVPSNIYIIGMMNTADRSLAMIDYALRRRFSFFEMKPGFETDSFNNHILGWSSPKLRSLIKAIIELNEVISDDDSLGPGFCIGHSYLCNFDNGFDLDSIVEYDIIPMLREYWFDNDERFNQEAQKLRNALK
ncbi:MAG: AAA family ATPase [Prevotella sp.]|nr:AAA family ATPase [Prevotella sp.]